MKRRAVSLAEQKRRSEERVRRLEVKFAVAQERLREVQLWEAAVAVATMAADPLRLVLELAVEGHNLSRDSPLPDTVHLCYTFLWVCEVFYGYVKIFVSNVMNLKAY